MIYSDLIRIQPQEGEHFFAFSDEQFNQGHEKMIRNFSLSAPKIYSAGAGLYGTREGLKVFFQFFQDRDKEIASTCSPQEVYNYEYYNHECEYTGDDTEAMAIVKRIYGEDVLIIRKN